MRVVALAVLIGVVVVVGLMLFGGGGGGGYTVTARFINAGQLVKGNEVQVGGVPAGLVDEIEITPDGRADITFSVDEGIAPLPVGTRAIIKQQSLSGIANRYVSLDPGLNSNPEVGDGGLRQLPVPRPAARATAAG